MDPNANLTMIRALVADIFTNESLSLEEKAQAGEELAGYVEELDEWLCKAGFMPDAWARGPA